MSSLDLLQLLGGTLAKGAVILLAAHAGTRLLHRRSAAARYAVWAAALAGLLLLPPLSLALPSLDAPVVAPRGAVPPRMPPAARPRESWPPGAVTVPRPGSSVAMAVGPRDGDMAASPALEVHRRGALQRTLRLAAPWLVGGWLLGALVVFWRLARDVRRISRLTGRAALLRRGPLLELAGQVAAELGVRQPVRIALSRELTVPVTWGLLRPVVLLPAAARRWDLERRRVVLRHELAHVRRADYAGHLLTELACAVHWPDPLAWRAARRARLEQEQACDDRVLALGTGSVDYAQHLLDIARTFASATVPVRGALAMAAAATLPERMRAILDGRLDHRPAGRRMLLSVAAAALLLGVPTAAVHPWSDGRRDAELMALLRSPEARVRRDAVWALGAREAGGARTAIVTRLRDEDPATRGVAAWALGKLGDRAALDPLVAALGDADAHVREMAVLALGELGDARAVPALARLAGDPEHGVRSVMTVALRQIAGEAAADALARLVRSDPDAHTRVMAAGALAKFESRGRLAALEGALADSAAEVRATAAWALQELHSRGVVPALLTALVRERDVEARDALVHALGASDDARATPGLVSALRDTVPELRQSAAQMLGGLDDERAVEPLIIATRDPDHRVRLTAVWALDALQRSR